MEKKILRFFLIAGLVLLPTIFTKRPRSKWLLAFLINSYANTLIAPYLAYKKYLSYPKRIGPKIYQSSIIYDYLWCSLITVWFCQSTQNTNWKGTLGKALLFVTPQVLLEYILERKTKLIKYSKGWKWYHSFISILFAKLSIKGLISLLDR